ncbi:DUF2784 domain-containing protein [Crenobacter luteus]|uniref:DUF2784 domain-containing protein n=1 Tax=Crenobacter luteus TaxID=1452487 RepID=A0A165FHB9_9NEIS|nr:DUF2784 domain-containing protein [Crenobacter luteus]KZE33274.1 hypothetical protein AVW16_08900 [Crenobacter luteus]
MGWRLAADAVLVVHLAFIVFVLLGGLAVRRWPRLAWLHLPAVAWGVTVELTQGVCPLTPLENALRRAAGDAGYAGGFVEHYLLALIYPDGLAAGHQLALGLAVLAVNALVYLPWLRSRRRQHKGDG